VGELDEETAVAYLKAFVESGDDESSRMEALSRLCKYKEITALLDPKLKRFL